MRRVTEVVVGGVLCCLLLVATPAHATYPGKNGRIAFALDRGSGAEIYTMKSNGSGQRRLTHQDRSAWFPFWSPDGRMIVFELDYPSEDCGSIELMDADGTDLLDLTGVSPVFRHGCAQGPSFTPDGRRILFAAETADGPGAIWSVDLRGERVRRIVRIQRLDKKVPGDKLFKSPRVSPDGKTLMFLVEHSLRHLGSNEKGLFSIGMDGKHLREIVPFSYDVSLKGGEWSPSGNRILFSVHAGPLPSTEPQNIFTIRPDGTGLRQLTNYRRLLPDLGTGAGSYSPDGRWVMFKHVSDGRNTVWKVHPDGSHLTRIARAKYAFSGATVWGPRLS